MQKFIRITAVAAPLPLANVDTDMIIPAQYMKSLTRIGLGRHLFQELRFAGDAGERDDFILNKPAFRKAQILIADRNFGCGSSREHAVWALADFGIRCVIAPSFGDIFFNNCFQNGVLAIRLPAKQVNALAAAAEGGRAFTVDLPQQRLLAPDGSKMSFEVEPLRRESLLEGLDDIGLTLKHAAAIDAWESADLATRPWQWPALDTSRPILAQPPMERT